MKRRAGALFVLAACGGSNTSVSTAPASRCAGPPPDPSYVCAQACPPPVARPDDPPPGYVWAPPKHVRDGKVFPCPICLPEGTRIAAPGGDRRVEDVREGDVVWSRDLAGRRVAARVVLVGATPVFAHRLVRVTLADGRVVDASAGHPTAAGRPLGALAAGDLVDGSTVERVSVIPYRGEKTYDLLPDGPTVTYFADDVAMSSTLSYIAPP